MDTENISEKVMKSYNYEVKEEKAMIIERDNKSPKVVNKNVVPCEKEEREVVNTENYIKYPPTVIENKINPYDDEEKEAEAMEIENDIKSPNGDENISNLSENSEAGEKNVLTLKELAEELSEKQKIQEFAATSTSTPEKFELSDEMIFKETISKLISMEALHAIPSPWKENCSNMGCETPVNNLMKDFSPSVCRYMEKSKETRANKNGYDFVKNMSPTSLSLAMMANSSTNNNNDTVQQEYNKIFKSPIPPPMEVKTEKGNSNNNCYPGSMLHSSEIDNGFDLESYLSAQSNEEQENEEYLQTHANQPYVQEVIDHYQQNGWSPTSANHYMGEGNILPPVMLSSYEEIEQLQQELQSTPGMSQYVLPIFFQPFMLPSKNKIDKENNKKAIKDFAKAFNDPRPEAKTDQIFLDKSDRNSFAKASTDTAEQLLTKCKIALDPETCEIRHRNASHSNSMKYLEEAAVRLLQDDFIHHRDKKNVSKIKGESGKFNCSDCGRSFNRLYTLSTHQRIHTGEKPYVCEICGVGFRQSGTKLNHIRAVHTKERPFECHYCGKTFSHKSSITVHIRIHTNEKPYQCGQCMRRFTDRATYLKHQAIHSGIKPYRCPICTKCFSQKSNLKRHFKNVHQTTEGEPGPDNNGSPDSLFA